MYIHTHRIPDDAGARVALRHHHIHTLWQPATGPWLTPTLSRCPRLRLIHTTAYVQCTGTTQFTHMCKALRPPTDSGTAHTARLTLGSRSYTYELSKSVCIDNIKSTIAISASDTRLVSRLGQLSHLLKSSSFQRAWRDTGILTPCEVGSECDEALWVAC